MKTFSDESVNNLIALVAVIVAMLIVILMLISHANRLEALEMSEDSLSIEVRLEQPEFLLKSPREGLMEALEYYNIPHADIVFAQAYLETGNFNSDICINNNNVFGLYNSAMGRYMKFDHWVTSVKTYKKCFSDKYTDTTEDYYQFLQRMNYTTSKNYKETVEKIRKQLFK